jgi:hypothetical protein
LLYLLYLTIVKKISEQDNMIKQNLPIIKYDYR